MRKLARYLPIVALLSIWIYKLISGTPLGNEVYWGILLVVSVIKLLKHFLSPQSNTWSVENVKEPLGLAPEPKDFKEFFLRYNLIEKKSSTFDGCPTHFICEYYDTVFEIKLLQKKGSARLLMVVEARCKTPGNFVLRDDEELRKALKAYVTVPVGEDQRSRDLLLCTPAIQRQLARLKPAQFVLMNRSVCVAAAWINWSDYTPDLISRYCNALFDLHVYAKRTLTTKDVNVEASSKEGTCPYCKSDIDPAALMKCEKCSTAHHLECWNENSGCAIFGCKTQTFHEPLREQVN